MSKMISRTWTRLSISINPEIEEKLVEIQQRMIQIDGKPHSMSKVINTVLVAGIVGSSKLNAYEWSLIKSISKGKRIELNLTVGEEYTTNISAQIY